jgi:hypothetical protein
LKDDKKRVDAESPEILNDGLDLAMDWGEDWIQPIQERLAILYPDLTGAELDEYDAVCRGAMDFGNAQMIALAKKLGKDPTLQEFRAAVVSQYPWVSDDNIPRLYSQGMYYAWHDGYLV